MDKCKLCDIPRERLEALRVLKINAFTQEVLICKDCIARVLIRVGTMLR